MKEVETLEIDGKEYFLVDKILDKTTNYYYFANINDTSDIQILKDKDEEYIKGLDTEVEFDKALEIYLLKHKNDN